MSRLSYYRIRQISECIDIERAMFTYTLTGVVYKEGIHVAVAIYRADEDRSEIEHMMTKMITWEQLGSSVQHPVKEWLHAEFKLLTHDMPQQWYHALRGVRAG